MGKTYDRCLDSQYIPGHVHTVFRAVFCIRDICRGFFAYDLGIHAFQGCFLDTEVIVRSHDCPSVSVVILINMKK